MGHRAPCTLRHRLRSAEPAERSPGLYRFERISAADAHLCCESAGIYSTSEPTLSKRLLERTVEALAREGPEVIATANHRPTVAPSAAGEPSLRPRD